jgi:hypothetical protein
VWAIECQLPEEIEARKEGDARHLTTQFLIVIHTNYIDDISRTDGAMMGKINGS